MVKTTVAIFLPQNPTKPHLFTLYVFIIGVMHISHASLYPALFSHDFVHSSILSQTFPSEGMPFSDSDRSPKAAAGRR